MYYEISNPMITRILIVGLGSIGQRHLRLARELLPSADIRVLRSNPDNKVPLPANGCFSSLDQAIAFAPQVAVIANPAPFHMQMGVPLANAGCHLLVEKPLAESAKSAEMLIQSCRNAQVILQTGYNMRFQSSLLKFKEIIDSGLVGDIWSIRCEVGQFLPTWRPGTDYRLGVSAQQKLGGGVLFELSHEIDYLRWIFGKINWVRATLVHQSNLETDVEDTAHIILGFAQHAATRPIASISLDFIRRDATRICTVIGAYGSLRWNGVTGVVDYFSETTSWQTLFAEEPVRDNSYIAQWQTFLEKITNNECSSASGADSLAVLRIIEAARRSHSDNGSQINIEKS